MSTLFRLMFSLACVCAFFSSGVHCQSLSSKLSQTPDFFPSAGSPKDQLIEVAKHYEIPIGIEWVANTEATTSSPLDTQPTVLGLINAIVQQSPGHSVTVDSEMLRVRYEPYYSHIADFLNLRLAEFKATEINVFDAEYELRTRIHLTLHPSSAGYNGGYGFGVPRTDCFDKRNISFTYTNVSVREVLDEIVKRNGNALWVVELSRSKMMKDEPFFAQMIGGDIANEYFSWRIVPLADEVPACTNRH